MSEQTPGPASSPTTLPADANLDWLRKQAKRRLVELRKNKPAAKLTDAQLEMARELGFTSWRALKSHIDSLTVEGQLFDAARTGDDRRLGLLLDAHPDKLHARAQPYDMSLLHLAAQSGTLAAVNLLLERGLGANTLESGDNTYAMHWAAAAGNLDIVRRLADGGGDVIGHGDDHEMEVIGWACQWDGGDDAAHRAVVDFLVTRGARHHIFSAIALGLADEVRHIVTRDPATLNSRMSRNENHQTPLHYAVNKNRPEIATLLLQLGADPLAVDGVGQSVATYASAPDVDRPVMERIRELTTAELSSAQRGHRPSRVSLLDLAAALSLRDWETAERLLAEHPRLFMSDGPAAGALHLMAKRNDTPAVKWLLDHGADPSGRWTMLGAEVTPLHLAAWHDHVGVARVLLDAGADPTIHDSEHDGTPLDWARYAGKVEMVRLLEERVT